MYIIVGLGNPTSQYEKTRHNVGFDAIDIIAEKNNIKVDVLKNKSMCGAGLIGRNKVVLVKPMTYMNLSGEAVKAFISFYKINPEDELIVIYDDISLDVGRLRLRKKGSAGGHNGIKSIINHLGNENFKRIKVGVGAKPDKWDLADYVLSRFDISERKSVDEALLKASESVDTIINDSFETAMNRYNN